MKLNMEQRRIVELEPNGHMMVKGVAGSGKTTVSIRRISFLQHHYCHEPDDSVLFVTYNKTLLRYIKHQYEKMADDEQLQLEQMFSSDRQVNITTIDSLMYKYFTSYCERNRQTVKIVQRQQEHQIFNRTLHQIKDKYPTIKLLTPKNSSFLLDEIAWMNACQIETVDAYQQVDRVGRANGGGHTPQKLLKDSPVRAALFELMELFHENLAREGFVTFKKMNLMALEEAQQMNHGRYTHIIIDESQDLTKVQLEFLKCIYQPKKYSSIMFVADNTQSIYSQSWLGKGRAYTTIGYDMSGKSRTLSKNYRTTTEISTAAYQLIEHDETIRTNVDFVKPSLIDRHGHPPIYRYCKNIEEQLRFLAQEIKLLEQDYPLSSICIVAKEKNLIESTCIGLEQEGIPCEVLNTSEPNFESNKVKLVTMHSIKGLEFKVIFLIHLDEGVIPNHHVYDFEEDDSLDSEERKLLYVGMTRANELLYMTSVKKPSKFIKELNYEHLRMKRDCQIKPFQTIGIQNYMLSEQIVDLHSKEEVVRQWLMKQLQSTYSYPYELMELEYPVQQFSRRGYMDLVVHIYKNGEAIPYIGAEVKQLGFGIHEAIAQLKSYMESNVHIQYGIATDGLEIAFFDRNGDSLLDIPKCSPHFLPETKNKQMYMNLKNQKKYMYMSETDDAQQIEISDVESGLYMEYDTFAQVPVVGNVAAGIPIVVDEQFEQMIHIPKEWILSEQNTFALIVTGDSMIDAGIEKGDIAIVHRQSAASKGDIVIAIIDHEATMKKYTMMGDSVLLLSENSKYEPIQMKQEDVLINGKVIGILKSSRACT